MTVDELFEKALRDPAFWDELQKDPAKAFRDAHIKVTPTQVQALKPLNYDALEAVASAFGSTGNVT
jgi:hypothetical protein